LFNSNEISKLIYKTRSLLLAIFLTIVYVTSGFAQKELLDEQQKYMDSLITLSYDLESKGSYKEAFELNVKTLQIALNKKDDYYTSLAYGYLGYDFFNQGDTIEALKNFKLAHSHALKLGDSSLLANTYGDLAGIYSAYPGKMELSLEYTNKAIETYKSNKDTVGLLYIYHNHADALAENGKYEELKVVLDQLKDPMYEKYTDDFYTSSLNAMRSEYYYHIGNYSKADSLILAVIELVESKKLMGELEIAYDYYSQSLASQNRLEEAFEYRLKYEEVHDKNMNEKAAIANDKIAAAFQIEEFRKDLEKSEAQSEIQDEELYQKTLFNYGLIALSIVGLFAFYFTFNLSRKRKLLNQALKEKNKLYLNEKTKTEKLARAKSDFFSTVSHELRTPLYGVIGLSTILLENNKNTDITEDLKSLKFSADYLLALVNDVLQINKIDSNKIEEEQMEFDPRELLQKIVSTFEYMRRQNKNEINLHIGEGVPKILRGNATRLSQILMNLIGNASKFTENGLVEITVVVKKKANSEVTLGFAIKDNGEGIAESKQVQIFEEFKQGDSLSYNYQGTGLGLPIVKRLLILSNSDIHLDSKIGEGSTFTFDLKYTIVSNSQSSSAKSKKPFLLESSILNGKQILIAEDNRINQMVTRKILEKDGVLCTVVENGKDAVEDPNLENYDLILMDVNMPFMDGIEATKLIRQRYHTPIIALTAIEIEEMKRSILEAGMNDIIIKPYDVKVFKQVIIENLLNKN
jgi:signal transduction histidine kinase/CheY-like chemotaxis protein